MVGSIIVVNVFENGGTFCFRETNIPKWGPEEPLFLKKRGIYFMVVPGLKYIYGVQFWNYVAGVPLSGNVEKLYLNRFGPSQKQKL